MKHLCPWLAAVLAAVAVAGTAAAADPLAQLDEALAYTSPNGFLHADLSGRLDLEGYYVDQTPPGLLFARDDFFFNPRLTLFLDTRLGPRLYSLVQFRADRGFDPGAVPRAARLDEYLLRYTPWDDARLNVQVGKFATVFGDWVNRHDTWNSPFITAPAAYENVTIMTDQVVPGSPAAFLARKNVADQKGGWLPVVWGPAYTSGAAVFGRWRQWEYAAEFKNASISSRPFVWDATDLGWENPTWSGRLAWRPNATWKVGASASRGAYLLPGARGTLPAGRSLGDYAQTTVGHDVSFAWRRWQAWGEFLWSRFAVPNVGHADTAVYFLEVKYKATPRLFLAARWNQQFFAPVDDGAGGRADWDRDLWRAEAAVGYRFSRHVQGKLQYGYSHQRGGFQQGEQLVAAQLTLRF